jgi:hypothetical protein
VTFSGAWIYDDTDALDGTCTVTLPTDPFTPSTADEYGMGAAFKGTPSTVSLSCMLIPPKSFADRESGHIVSTPKQLLIKDTNTQVEESSRITYQSLDYLVDTLHRDGDLVLASLKRG